MLKREITYEDFEGNEITEVFYFNISKPELVELEVEKKEGFDAWIKQIIEAEDNKTLVGVFKKIVLMAYGQKSEDGKRFIKSDQMAEEFSQTNAYSELFMELATNEGAAAEFLIATLPKDMAGEVQKAMVDTKDPTADPELPVVKNS